MARDPQDIALQNSMPDYFAKKAEEFGAKDVDHLTDEEHRAVANAAFRQRANTTLDNGKIPGWLAKAEAVGLTPDQIANVAYEMYDGLTPAQAVARYKREVARFGGFDVPEPKENPYFDDPING